MAIFGHRSEASLRNYIGHPSSEKIRACSDILSNALSSRAIFMFCWIWLSFIHKTLALNCLFSTCHVKKLARFYEPQFGRVSLNISFSDSVLETKKLQEKVLNSTYRTILVWKVLQNVNFDAFCELWWFDIVDSFSLVQPIRIFEPF